MESLFLSAVQPAQNNVIQPMSTLGWIFMIVSVGFVVLLTLWCYIKVLSLPTDPGEMEEK